MVQKKIELPRGFIFQTGKDKMVTKKNNSHTKWPWWRWVMIILTLLALILSSILSWHFIAGGSMAGCGGGSPCDQVLGSRWSMLFGILPVSALAIGAYMTLLVSIFFIGPETDASIRRLAWNVMIILSGSIAGSAIWFTIVQKWIIGEFCVYCMTAHTAGFLLSILIIRLALKNSKNIIIRPVTVMGLVLIGLISAGAVVILQTSYTPSTVYTDGETQPVSTTIDYNNSPMVGSSDATYIVDLLFDYQCPHCQKLHFFLEEATLRYNGKLAFALCPAPLNNQCNSYIPPEADAYKNSCELTRISMAVWVADHKVFHDFDTWMFSFESGSRWQPRTPEAARAKAVEMIGKENFDKAYSDPWIDQYIQNSVEIYGKTIRSGNGGVPKMVFGSNWVIPEPYSIDELIMILQENLGVPKP